MIGANKEGLSKEKPLKALLGRTRAGTARNSAGRITTRHRGGGHKKRYRMIDWKQDKLDVQGKIEGIEYDPYRTAHIARVLYSDGERRYILAAEGMKEGDMVTTSDTAEPKVGIRTKISRVPAGTFVYNIESAPGKGGGLARSAGAGVQVLGTEGKYTQLKMPSGEIRKVLAEGYATIGKASNPEHNLQKIGKAGRSRWMGKRPTVRGSAMNATDHPYGGGEGKTQRGTKRPKTKWGKVTGGRKTRRKKKWSNKLIIKRRKTKR